MKMRKKLQNEKGMALVVILAVVVLMSLIGTTILFSSNTGRKISTSYKGSADALQNADAGISEAAQKLFNKDIVAPETPCGGISDAALNWKYDGYTKNIANEYTVSYVFREDNAGVKSLACDEAGHPLYQIISKGYVTPTGGSAFIAGGPVDGKLNKNFVGTSSGAAGVEKKLLAMLKMNGSGKSTPFDCGVFGDDGVILKGQGYIDSYDSSKTPWTTQGQFENGSIATNAKGTGVINLVGQGKVYGDASVGLGGNKDTDITISGQGEIFGDKYVLTAKKDMTPQKAPNGGTPLTISGTMDLIGQAEPYRVDSVNLAGQNVVTISGDVILIVDHTFKTAGQSKLLISEGASLTMYVAGNIDMAGQGIVNQNQKPEKVLVYGTETCTNVKLAGQSVLYAALYTPKAVATFTGQADIFGSVITKKITVTGQGSIHYDESLKNQGGGGGGGTITGYKLLSWKEL